MKRFDITNCDLPKRTYLGFIYHSECSECGSVIEFDFDRDYLSYPSIGENTKAYTVCNDCGKEHFIFIKLSMQAEITENEG